MCAPMHRLRNRVVDRGAGALDTHELLDLLVHGAEVDQHVLIEFSQLVDRGVRTKTGAGAMGVGIDELPSELAAVVEAAAELGRRLTALPSPELVRGLNDIAVIGRRELGARRRECVLVIICDSANRPLRTVVVSDGAADRSMIPVRETLNAVLRWDGRAFAVAHNHPCADSEPSHADVAATRQLIDASRVVGLRFLGHVVVSDGGWTAVTT